MELDVGGCLKLTDASIVEVVEKCNALQTLGVCGSRISDKSFKAVAVYVNMVNCLNLDGAEGGGG